MNNNENYLKNKYIAIIGPNYTSNTNILNSSYNIAKYLAQRGAIILTGGLGGVMEFAAKGSLDAGGMNIGFLPSTDRTTGNKYHKILISTGLGEMRNFLLIRSADIVISIGCSWGTLSEISISKRENKPIFLLYPWKIEELDNKYIYTSESILLNDVIDFFKE